LPERLVQYFCRPEKKRTGKGGKPVIILTEREIRQICSMKDCLDDVERAFRLHAEGKANTPVRLSVDHPEHGGHTLYMPSYMGEIAFAAVKVVSIFPGNAARGKKTLSSALLLTETRTGEHVALMDASWLTVMRTGAVTGVAARYLAREDAESCLVIGCGAQAIGQIEAVLEVRSIRRLLLWNRTRERAEKLAETLRLTRPEFDGKIRVVDDVNAAVEAVDIIVCATRSEIPVFDGSRLRPGVHISAIGSYQPHMREFDLNALLKSDKVVADTREGVMHEAGDLIIPHQRGEWSFDRLHAELGEIVAGRKPGRERAEEITLFKSVGAGFLDVLVAASVYGKAKSLGLGTDVGPLMEYQ
jgi:ornithine cyclodeaminase/alanine dehydrogenase-like protein (mu-crystallin family)